MLTFIFGEQCSLDQRLSAFLMEKSSGGGMGQAVAEIRVAMRMILGNLLFQRNF